MRRPPPVTGADPRTIPGALLIAAERYAETTALVSDDWNPTWRELCDDVLAGAAALIERGVAPGERVALWGANTTEWVTANLAVLCAGAVVVPVNNRYRAEEAADILGRSKVRVVLADGTAQDRSLATEVAEMGLGELVLVLDGEAPSGVESWKDARAAASVDGPELARRLAGVTPGDVSHIQFTSGTTGRPKGAMLAHGAMVETTTSWAGIVGIRAGDRYPVVAPFSHVAGHKSGILASVVTGAAIRPLRTPDPEVLADLVVRGEAQVLQGAPALFQGLLAALERRGDRPRGVRTAVAGASVVPPVLVRTLRQALGVEAVLNGYGLSETTGVVSITRPDDPEEVVVTSCGRPVPGVEIRIVGPEGDPVADGPGEVEVRGINVMLGYLDDPAATAEIMHDGWLRTGDVGTLDETGNLRIVDRLKDMIVVGGYNVYPAEIERILSEVPAVAQVAVVGVTDERMGEVPVAFVVPAPAIEFDPAATEADCRRRLAGFKVPRRYVVVGSLPITPAGKVDKRSLRATLATLPAPDGAAPSR